MQYIQTVLNGCSETNERMYPLRELLASIQVDDLTASTPNQYSVHTGMSESDMPGLCTDIIKNYLTTGVKLRPSFWIRICTYLSELISAKDETFRDDNNKITPTSSKHAFRTVLCSMLLILSTNNRTINMTMLNQPVVVFSEPYMVDELTVTFLSCQRSKNAFKTAAGTFFNNHYRISPHILEYTGFNNQLEGLQCLNNCIAVRSDILQRVRDGGCATAQIRLANLVGALCQHGLWRHHSTIRQYNVATPAYFPAVDVGLFRLMQESGERFERTMWTQLPGWGNPLDRTTAESLAQTIVTCLETTGQLPVFDQHLVDELQASVGWRNTQTIDPHLGNAALPGCFESLSTFM